MRRLALAPILVCALLSPSTALALGVGDIELQSALNQPLDAEIPLRGVSAEERGDIVVTLASKQAFRDVGLERPFSLKRLEFEVASRNGSHYIQVSSNEPITEPFLSFLIEVDSPQGNLLREYTVLLDPPVFASEESRDSDGDDDRQQAARAPGQASGAAGSTTDDGGMSGRVAGGGSTADSDDAQASDMSASAPSASARDEFSDTPTFLRIARKEEAAERRKAEQAARRQREQERQREAVAAARERVRTESASDTRGPSGATRAGSGSGDTPESDEAESRPREYGPVREGETLWNIADRLKRGEVTTQQMMLALLRYNPEAFDSSNVNRLKQGYVLRVPEHDEVRSISAQRAIAQVREQNGLWREWRDSLQKREATRVAAAQGPQSADEPADTTDSGADEGQSSAADASDDSRLEIVGADEGGATSDESASATAGGSSDTREQLQLAREELASVRSEKEDLAERVEQLESTVSKMEQLVTVREQQLAQLERQLAEMRDETDASDDTATAAADDGTQDEEVDTAADSGGESEDGQGDTVVADASGSDTSGGGDGGPAASGGSGGAGGSGAAGDSAATEGPGGDSGATAAGGGDTAASADDTDTQTAASDQQREVVNPADDTDPQQERGWLDAALGFLGGIGTAISGAVGGGPLSLPVIGGAGAAVLALALLAVRRRRAAQAAADEELMGPVAVGERHAETAPMGLGGDDSPGAEPQPAAEDTPSHDSARASLMDEELDLSGLDADPEAATPGDEAEQDDTLVEADTYLAYGLHQQAEDLLRLALEEHPERLDYSEKLLETLAAAGKSDEFVSVAEDFRNRLAEPSSPAWQRVSAMGQRIAPDSALFAAGTTAAGGAAMAAGGGDALDDDFAFDLDSDSAGSADVPGSELEFGESAPSESPTAGDSGADDLTFDLSDLDSSTAAAESATDSGQDPAPTSRDEDAGLDFDLSDFGADDGASSLDSESVASDTDRSSSSAEDGLDFDLGDLGIDDSASTGAPSEGAAHGGDSPSEDGGEIDLSDLGGLDLDDDSGDSTAAAAPADSGEGEIDLSFDLDESSSNAPSDLSDFSLGDSQPDAATATGGDTSTASTEGDPFAGLDDFGVGDSGPTTSTAVADQSSAGTSDDEDPFAGLEDLGDGDAVSDSEFDMSSFEQGFAQTDATPASAVAEGGDASGGGDDDDLATMLDLAKAYIDMGDAESASNALEEVIAGGTEQQRAEARSLLENVQ